MKKLIAILLIGCLFGCKKKDVTQPKAENEFCKELSVTPEQRQRIKERADSLNAGNNRVNYIDGLAHILIDFDGHTTTNTQWNSSGYGSSFTCNAVNFTSAQKLEIMQRVREDFKPFTVVVTDVESEWTDANPYARMRVVVTSTSLSTSVAGLAYVNSITWGDNTPCFVFTENIYNDIKNISETISHEVGHTFGLHHWALFDGGCNLITEYYTGSGSGNNKWSPIMGTSYTGAITTFGPNAILQTGCTNTEDQFDIISQTAYYKIDNVGATTSNNYYTQYGVTMGQGWSWSNILENSNDADMYKVVSSNQYYFKVEPSSQLIDGGNTDFAADFYNSSGVLQYTVQNSNDGGVGPTLVNNNNIMYIKIRVSTTAPSAPFACQRGGYVASTW